MKRFVLRIIYDVGDLWVDGKELRRCVTARETGSYMVNDWVIAVYYDNTKTTIDGGIVTSGTIQVAGDNKSILAGITGQGTTSDSIRFWAGSSFENRASAPFRVMQNGEFYATKAYIEGEINATSGIFRGKVYATDGELNGDINIGNGAIKLNKDGSGSLGNGGLTWQADFGVMTIKTLQLGQVWGFSKLPVLANYNNISALSALAHLNVPSKKTVKLPANPNIAKMYTIINHTQYNKTINGNGNKIWWRKDVSLGNYGSTSTYNESDNFLLAAYATITLMFDGTWYIVAER